MGRQEFYVMDDALTRTLTPSQQKAVSHIEGPLLVLAGPGSGKTRVITHRIASLIRSGVAPHNICAITFTNKAAEEMRQRAYMLGASGGAHISTFHSLCVRILRQYWREAQIEPNFSIYDDSDQKRCMKAAVKECNLDTQNFPPARMREAVSTLKNKLIDPEKIESEYEDFFSKMLARVYRRYQDKLAELNAMDFDDLLAKTAYLLSENDQVRSELSNRYRFLLIDEYQDTNNAQYMIAKLLASEHHNICATGDPDQSIYRWRGADIRNILAFEKDWPDAVSIKLEENFRSSSNILEVADKLIAYNRHRKVKRLVPTLPPSKGIEVRCYDDERAEAEGIAACIKQLLDEGARPNEIAVFYRVNAMSRAVEESLIRHKIPYQIVRGVEFYNRKEIRDIIAYMKVLANPSDSMALVRIINTPTRGIGKVTVDRIATFASRSGITFYEALKRAEQIETLGKAAKAKLAVFAKMIERFRQEIDGPVAPLTEQVFEESGLADFLRHSGTEGKNALENVNELISSAAQYDEQAESPSLVDYLQQIALFSDADAYDAASGQVALMTLHAAKGLEFENVLIMGLEEGILPHERTDSQDEQDLEEERRLLFVGITRAKSYLHLSYARYRTIRGQMLRSVPSQFLFELGVEQQKSEQIHSEPEPEQIDVHPDYDQPDPFVKGQLVRHPKFGLGRVQDFVNMGENSQVTVRFNAGRTKTLMLKYANLTPL